LLTYVATVLGNVGGKKKFRVKTKFIRYSKREQDILAYDMAKHAVNYEPNGNISVLDVSQNIHRYPRRTNACPTLLPGGKITIVRADAVDGSVSGRPLSGVEALRLQGMHESMAKNPGSLWTFDNKDVKDLAGNAFSVPQSQLATLIALVVFDLPDTKAAIEQRRTSARQFHAVRSGRR